MKKYNKQILSQLVRRNITKYRKIRNLTLQELADETELTHQYLKDLASIEAVDKTPTLETLGKFANALDIDIKQLFDEIKEDDE